MPSCAPDPGEPVDLSTLLAGVTGFLAQLVDGSLGMGYGITSASLLLATGLAPATVSASVKVAQLGTTVASGVSHWRAGNVDPRIVARLALPGGIGALLGATALSALSTAAAAPVMALLLFALGILVILRFVTRPRMVADADAPSPRRRLLLPLGLVGGFVDATGGGGWGPVVTSTLLTTTPAPPRRVIGSVSTCEAVVTACAALGFLVGMGLGGLPLAAIIALMVGGVLAAPLAARLTGLLPPRILGVAVGSLIITLNAHAALAAIGLAAGVVAAVQIALALACLTVLAAVVVRHRRELRRAPQDGTLGNDPVHIAGTTVPAARHVGEDVPAGAGAREDG